MLRNYVYLCLFDIFFLLIKTIFLYQKNDSVSNQGYIVSWIESMKMCKSNIHCSVLRIHIDDSKYYSLLFKLS